MAKALNSEEDRLTLREQMLKALDKLQAEVDLKKANMGWMVQYIPCGHYRELEWTETELVNRAKERGGKYWDALPLSSNQCPECTGQKGPSRI